MSISDGSRHSHSDLLYGLLTLGRRSRRRSTRSAGATVDHRPVRSWRRRDSHGAPRPSHRRRSRPAAMLRVFEQWNPETSRCFESLSNEILKRLHRPVRSRRPGGRNGVAPASLDSGRPRRSSPLRQTAVLARPFARRIFGSCRRRRFTKCASGRSGFRQCSARRVSRSARPCGRRRYPVSASA
jgi:hypothetical protein